MSDLQFLGKAALDVATVDNPDGVGLCVMLTMNDPTGGRHLAALLPAATARSVAEAILVAVAEVQDAAGV